MRAIDESYVKSLITKRKPDAHKGDFGRVLIFAGSLGMAGAAVLCGRAALRSGAGLVRFLLPSPESPLVPILQVAVPEATCVIFKEDMDLSEYTAVAAGPGLGKGETSFRILSYILETYKGTMVLDADALNMIAAEPDLLSRAGGDRAHMCGGQKLESDDLPSRAAPHPRLIMTPHPKEAERLLGGSRVGIKSEAEREAALYLLAKKYPAVIILKGAGSLVGTADECRINTTGNPGMATAGSGDVLTGVAASLAAQGFSPRDAAAAGAYIHGLSGDIAAEEIGQAGMTASDIVDCLPRAFKRFEK